ncbi:MAG: hypothetical protein MUF23_05555 [Pirellula sp.]|jgi:hypothetical protein|nr:hypothetical protein [Pirellula sp.]
MVLTFVLAWGFLGGRWVLSQESAGSQTSSDVTVVTTDPNLLLLAAIRQAVWGPPVSCKVQQSTKAFGQQSIMVGDFKSMGQGTGRFRYSVRVAVGETSFDLLQISDGELMWTQCGNSEAPRRVNLRQVRESVSYAMQVSDSRPEVNLVLAVGGQADLLRALYQRYNWYKAVGGKLAGVDVWQLVGRVRTEPPKLAGSAPIDEENSVTGDATRNTPTEVRLTLSRSANLPYFPYMIEYFDRGKDAQGQASGLTLVTRIEFTDANTNVLFQDQDFQYRISDSTDQYVDETKRYLPKTPITGLAPFGVDQ